QSVSNAYGIGSRSHPRKARWLLRNPALMVAPPLNPGKEALDEPASHIAARAFNTSGHIPIPRVAASGDPSYSPYCGLSRCPCWGHGSAVIFAQGSAKDQVIFEASSGSASGISGTVDAFRADLGTLNPNNAGS